jgi:hypothetical protein
MDEYGIAAAARVGVLMYEQACRNSGRTSRMIERVTDEDQIIVPSGDVSRHVRYMLKEAGKKTQVFVVRPGDVPMRTVGTAPKGRTFFDHTWIEQHVLHALTCSERDLEAFQRATSKTWPEKPKADSQSAGRMNEWAVQG